MNSNHIKDHLCIGVIDQGEKDYLLKCIHEGLVPLPRSASIDYILVCFDENMQIIDYRFTTKLRPTFSHTELSTQPVHSSQLTQEYKTSIVEGVTVAFDKNDTASQLLSPLNSDMTKKNTDRNELWYDFTSIPTHVKHVLLAIDTSNFDEKNKYLLYLSNDTEQILEAFYMPDIKQMQPSGYQILCTFERNEEDTWIVYRNDNATNIQSIDSNEIANISTKIDTI